VSGYSVHANVYLMVIDETDGTVAFDRCLNATLIPDGEDLADAAGFLSNSEIAALVTLATPSPQDAGRGLIA